VTIWIGLTGGIGSGKSQAAAEFSFFLAVPTMFAASAWKFYKLFADPASRQLLGQNIDTLIIGNVVAFVVAMLAIKFFIGFLFQ